MRELTLDDARAALDHISPDCGHDERARLAMALYAEFGGDAEQAWKDWAAGRSSPDLAEDRDTWRSARRVRKVTIATLIHAAQQAGWKLPQDGSDAPAPDYAALAAARERREKERKRQEEEYRQRADQAARDARETWQEAGDRREVLTPYLERKGVGAHGTRALADGTLLVPMRDVDGALANIQRIAPAKPAGDAPEKRYMPGARKQGLCHVIGTPPAADGVLLLGEGYATAASIYEACDRQWPVAVCFDAGNLREVAICWAEKLPGLTMLLCADDDRDTAARTGRNPGVKAAESAVRALRKLGCRAELVTPSDLPEGGSDFNDWLISAGPEPVRAAISRAVEVLCAPPEAEPEPAAADVPPWEEILADQVQATTLTDAFPEQDQPLPPVTEAQPGDASTDQPSGARLQVVVDNTGGAAGRGGGRRKRKANPEQPATPEEIEAARAAAQADQRRKERLFGAVESISQRYTLIYGTDTAWDAKLGVLIKISNMRLAWGNDPVKLWLARPTRRMVALADLVFEPGREVGDHQVNMFRGLELEPQAGDAEAVRPMLDLLRHLCSQSADNADDIDAICDWVLRWMALPLQQLGTKMRSALIFHGPQGSGKNLFFDAWRDVFGSYGKTIGQTEVEDKYNEWISCKLAFVANEVVSRAEMHHRKDALKMIVTEEQGFPIRGMHMATRWERNCANIVFLSNARVPLVIEDGDRRHLVVYVPLAADDALYERAAKFLDAGGLAQWMHYLQSYPTEGFSKHSRPPMTRDKQALIQASWRAPARFAWEWTEGYLDLPVRVCSGEQLYRAFLRWCIRSGERFPPNRDTFTADVHRWAEEVSPRDPVTGKRAAPALVCKPVHHVETNKPRRCIRTWLPAGAKLPEGVSLGQWAFDSAQAFEQDLHVFCRGGSVDGGDAS